LTEKKIVIFSVEREMLIAFKDRLFSTQRIISAVKRVRHTVITGSRI